MDWAYHVPGLNTRDRFVLVTIATYYNEDKGRAWMSQGSLAERTGYSRVTINAAVASLQQKGIVTTKQRRRADGAHSTLEYRFAMPLRTSCQSALQGGVKEIDRGVSRRFTAELHTKELHTKEQELHTSAAPTRETLDAFLEVWNDNRGALPAARVLSDSRRRALRALQKEHGAGALEMFRAAVAQVAADAFWQERAYGIDNLLWRGRVVEKAEKHQARSGMRDADRRLAARAMDIARAIGGA